MSYRLYHGYITLPDIFLLPFCHSCALKCTHSQKWLAWHSCIGLYTCTSSLQLWKKSVFTEAFPVFNILFAQKIVCFVLFCLQLFELCIVLRRPEWSDRHTWLSSIFCLSVGHMSMCLVPVYDPWNKILIWGYMGTDILSLVLLRKFVFLFTVIASDMS